MAYQDEAGSSACHLQVGWAGVVVFAVGMGGSYVANVATRCVQNDIVSQ